MAKTKNVEVNLNDFAVAISKEEGLKKEMSIAQIKEVSSKVLRKLKSMPMDQVMRLLARVR